MANRDMTPLQFSFEKARKTVDCHFYVTNGTGAVTVDGPGSKGILAVVPSGGTGFTVPAVNGLYRIQFGYQQGSSLNVIDTYIKALVLDNVPEIEYSGNAAPAATATLAIYRDDVANNVPLFGDIAPTQGSVTDGGTGGSLAASAYRWIVTAVDSGGNETQLATAIATEQTYTPTASHKANINWTALSLPGLIGYNIYRTAASGASGTENVFVGFAAGAATATYVDVGTAGIASYQSGTAAAVGGQKLANYLLTAYNFARPPFGYGCVSLVFLNGVTPTWPAQGEGMRIQIELGDSGAP
jgi:hypothetical protein